MAKGPGYPDWDCRLFALDVPGQPRLYLEGGDATAEKKKPGFKMLGVQDGGFCQTESVSASAGSKCGSQTPPDNFLASDLSRSRSKHLAHMALGFNSNLLTKPFIGLEDWQSTMKPKAELCQVFRGNPSYRSLVAEAPCWTEIARLNLVNQPQPSESTFA
ncbi:MAG: hypothetical protein Q9175_001348 [Cornicularia normoerica]